MVRQVFEVEHYWKVIVWYDADYGFFDVIASDLRRAGFMESVIDEVRNTMESNKAKAVTCSSERKHISIVIFNRHTSKADYLNSIVHEAEHIKQAILKAYRVEDRGEAPAYTIGYIVNRMYEVFRNLL